MIILEIADPWLAGTWYAAVAPGSGTVKDINGHILKVSDVVSLVGTIQNIQYSSLTTGDIQVALLHPNDSSGVVVTVNGTSLIAIYVSGP